jgi:2-dehydro-3-deoxygalactonokinase
MQADYILCCDWGTTSFRLRLTNLKADVIAETHSEKGILFFHNQWLSQNDDNLDRRFDYYLQYIQSQIREIHHGLEIDIATLPLVISGMAISSIGMINMPYENLPFSVAGTTGFECRIQKNGAPIILVTGVCSSDDIMRGEETQIIGLYHTPELNRILPDSGIFVLPGTHSKHVCINDKAIVSIKTFITGELFHILRSNGTLSKSIAFLQEDRNANPDNQLAFINGIRESKNGSLLNNLFQVRVNDILNKLDKEQNFYYLSGLLIGSEFDYLKKEAILSATNKLVVCCSQNFIPYYTTVLKELGLIEDAIFIPPALFDKATVVGQLTAYKKYFQSV